MSAERQVLVVGAGSIGTRHIEMVREFVDNIVVVDTNSNRESAIAALLEGHVSSYKFFNRIEKIPVKSFFSLVIISNWGPDHFQTYLSLQQNSKIFLIEKPLVSSLSDLFALKCLVEKNESKIVTNFQWNYSGFTSRLRDLIEKFDLGVPLDIQVFGGSKCIVTNGIHYLALASKVFNEYPIAVSSILNADRINPRGEKFLYYGGASVWQYPNDRNLTIHFQNKSNVSGVVRILFKQAILEVIGSTMSLHLIPKDEVVLIEKPVHTRNVADTVLTREAFVDNDGKDGHWHLLNLLINGKLVDDFETGYKATLGIFAALIANQEGRKIYIAELESGELALKYRNIDWGIT